MIIFYISSNLLEESALNKMKKIKKGSKNTKNNIIKEHLLDKLFE